ncbi:MAG: phosphodiester glycosidase family protein [Patescibacteria group bacterium]|nr:phosphodiester glycosidase family protein [Patescibacteria group bacterium]
MKKIIITLFIIFTPLCLQASLGADLSGAILLDVKRNGEAWYIYPEDNKRYYLGRPNDAFQIMRELGLGISEYDFQRIAQAGMNVDGDLELARRLSGKIIIQTEKNGEAWYIYPKNLKKYYLGRPKDAFKIMRELSLGISKKNLAKIHKPGLEENIDKYSNYVHKKINVSGKDYTVDVIEIDLRNPNLKIITDTADNYNCKTDCGVKALADFVLDNNGFAGINGTYFEAYDKLKLNYYFFPVYNSNERKLINADQLKYWTTGPIIVFDENNKFYYFKDSRDFKSVENFEEKYNVKIQAAIGNKPRLIEDKMNLLIEWDIDKKQRNVRAGRNAIAYKEDLNNLGKGIIYLFIVQNVTVPELADVVKEFGADYALNLDGGYSSALWYNDEYMTGPGRDIPNAIIFSEKDKIN